MENTNLTANENIHANNLSDIDVSSLYQKLEEINMRLQKLEEHFLVPVINKDEEKAV